jgi:hypothetical protein
MVHSKFEKLHEISDKLLKIDMNNLIEKRITHFIDRLELLIENIDDFNDE